MFQVYKDNACNALLQADDISITFLVFSIPCNVKVIK